MNTVPFPSDPSAQTAVLLASFNTPDRAHVDMVLRETGTPRGLYRLARQLRAAQASELRAESAEQQIEAMIRQAA